MVCQLGHMEAMRNTLNPHRTSSPALSDKRESLREKRLDVWSVGWETFIPSSLRQNRFKDGGSLSRSRYTTVPWMIFRQYSRCFLKSLTMSSLRVFRSNQTCESSTPKGGGRYSFGFIPNMKTDAKPNMPINSPTFFTSLTQFATTVAQCDGRRGLCQSSESLEMVPAAFRSLCLNAL